MGKGAANSGEQPDRRLTPIESANALVARRIVDTAEHLCQMLVARKAVTNHLVDLTADEIVRVVMYVWDIYSGVKISGDHDCS